VTQLDPTPAKRYIYDEMMSAGLVSRLGDFRIQELASAAGRTSESPRLIGDSLRLLDKIGPSSHWAARSSGA